MKRILGSISKETAASMVLYHAISSYQLLEVMLHRLTFHEKDKAILILPDFIVKKYPQYRKLATRHFFDEVYLFPYLHIPHRNEEMIIEDVVRYYRRVIPYDIASFAEIYVAGAHFYFSLYLIQNKIKFTFFEDAAGMLSRSEELHQTLSKKFPIHAAIAQKYGLYDGSNPLIEKIICLKRAQTRDVSDKKYMDFSVEEALQNLSASKRKKLIHFFLRRRLRTKKAILLTQNFANLGVMSEAEQRQMCERLRDGILQGVPLMIKQHPDDTFNYREIFPGAYVIRQVFPSELLPYLFRKKPQVIYTFDSTGCENLREHFVIRKIGRK